VFPDHRNAISVSAGYQYQNVLSKEDSASIIEKVGNVMHAFSGDDHDYCEVVHAENQQNVPEITVKSFSMAMGVPTPGFLMLSMYNPIDASGRTLPGASKTTIQTHLCLLPNQMSTYSRYGAVAFVSLALLIIRAFLVPVLKLQPFALDPKNASGLLPMFKAKVEDYDVYQQHSSGASGFSAKSLSSGSRDRSHSFTPGIKPNGLGAQARPGDHKHKNRHSKGGPDKWGWDADEDGGPRIKIHSDDDFYDGGKWKAAPRRPGSTVGVVGREIWTSVWRVAWMVVLLWGWLAYKG